MTDTVPFGKYKGRPVEDMLADAEYMAWLEAQPWFRERFAHLTARRDADAANRTPVHNRLQTLFLRPDYQWAFAQVAAPDHWHRIGEEARDRVKDRSRQDIRSRIAKLEARVTEASNAFMAGTHAADLAKLRQDLADAEAAIIRWEVAVAFEHRGADVFLAARALEENAALRHPLVSVEHLSGFDDCSFTLPIEIKPTVADEYPAVLRQMQRNKSRYLFVGAYQGEGATEAQFVAIFAASGIRVVFKRDVDVAASGGPG